MINQENIEEQAAPQKSVIAGVADDLARIVSAVIATDSEDASGIARVLASSEQALRNYRPEWWEVSSSDLVAELEMLRKVRDNTTYAINQAFLQARNAHEQLQIVIGERDRARDIAVHLEQELAQQVSDETLSEASDRSREKDEDLIEETEKDNGLTSDQLMQVFQNNRPEGVPANAIPACFVPQDEETAE